MQVIYKLRPNTTINAEKMAREFQFIAPINAPLRIKYLMSDLLEGLTFKPKKDYWLYVRSLSQHGSITIHKDAEDTYLTINCSGDDFGNEILRHGGKEQDEDIFNLYLRTRINEIALSVMQYLYTTLDLCSTARITDEIRFSDMEIVKDLPMRALSVLHYGAEEELY